VGQDKFTPALLQLAQMPEFAQKLNSGDLKFWVVDTNPEKLTAIKQLTTQTPSTVSHLRVQPPISARTMPELAKQLGDTIFDLVYVASPNETHATYIAFFLDRAKLILVEKPLVDHLATLSDVEKQFNSEALSAVRLVDHYLFKDVLLHFFTHLAQYLRKIGTVNRLAFTLIEAEPIRADRRWLYSTGMIRDLAVHGLSILFKFREAGDLSLDLSALSLVDCQKAQYDAIPDGVKNPQETAAHLEYRIGDVSFSIIVGKGAGFSRKEFQLVGERGTLAVDTLKSKVTLSQNGGHEYLYSASKPVRAYPEYLNLLKAYFSNQPQLGLSYQKAKTQIQLFEAIDPVKITRRYQVGAFPFC
jgi:predicted dehydrogenase